MNTPFQKLTSQWSPRAESEAGALEEALCKWCGRILIGGLADDAPTTDASIIRSFTDRHGITQLLAGLPIDIASPLSRVLPRPTTEAAVAEEMARTHEFGRVLNECRQKLEHPPVVIKGQALAHTMYTHPWQRPRGDIDVMVEATAVEELARVLVQMGYTRPASVEGDLVLTQTTFRRQMTGIEHVWDVHWQISNRPALSNTITYQGLVDSAVKVPIGHSTFLAPDRVNTLFVACVHLVGHHLGEPRMIWLYDIHLLAEALFETERHQLVTRARDQVVLLAVCHRALSITQKYLPGERIHGLLRALDPGESRRWPEKERYLTRLMDDARAAGRGNRLRLAAQHLFPSPRYMMRRFPIKHRWQMPLWYIIRLALAVPKLFRHR